MYNLSRRQHSSKGFPRILEFSISFKFALQSSSSFKDDNSKNVIVRFLISDSPLPILYKGRYQIAEQSSRKLLVS